MLLTNMDTENRKKYRMDYKRNTHEMVLIVPGVISDLSSKLYENPLICFP